ncbi:MAG: hypothetical protein WBO55_11315 [Rhizobiaceae bacterium]
MSDIVALEETGSVLSQSRPFRLVLVAVLILFALIGTYLSWKALFALNISATLMYSALALAGFWGAWHLVGMPQSKTGAGDKVGKDA